MKVSELKDFLEYLEKQGKGDLDIYFDSEGVEFLCHMIPIESAVYDNLGELGECVILDFPFDKKYFRHRN